MFYHVWVYHLTILVTFPHAVPQPTFDQICSENISELSHHNPGDVDIICFNSTSSQLQTVQIQVEVAPQDLPSGNPLTTCQPFSLLF